MSPVIEQRIRFRPSVPLPDGLLESLPDVRNVIYRGDVVVVTGNNNALNAVTSALARNQIVARQLRVDQANRADAFLTRTGSIAIPQLPIMAGWAVAFGLAAASFFRWE